MGRNPEIEEEKLIPMCHLDGIVLYFLFPKGEFAIQNLRPIKLWLIRHVSAHPIVADRNGVAVGEARDG